MHASYSASVDGDREDLVNSHVLQRQLYGSVLTCEERGRGRPKQGGGKRCIEKWLMICLLRPNFIVLCTAQTSEL